MVQDRGLKFGSAGFAGSFGGGTGDRAVGIGGGKLDRGDEGAFVGQGALGKAGDAEGAKGVAVPGALPRDEAAAGFLANGGLVLQGDLQAAFDGFGAAGDIDHFAEDAAAVCPDDRGQFFKCGSGEIVAVAVGDVGKLGGDGGVDLGVCMAEAIDGGATGAVDILLAGGVPQVAAFGMGDAGQLGGGFQGIGLSHAGSFGGNLAGWCLWGKRPPAGVLLPE